MDTTVSKWGNSLGIRIPAAIVQSSGISDGDKMDISYTPDGSIIIQKKKKDKSELKAFGILHRFAAPDLIAKEKDAFGMAMEGKYGKGKKDAH